MATVTHMTRDEWIAQLEACGNTMSQSDIIDLVYKDGPNAIYQEMVTQKHMEMDGADTYFRAMFPTVQWNDWQGIREIGTIYHNAYVPFDMGIFQRSMQICSPSDASECTFNYCEIPGGGISHLLEMEMYKTAVRTRPYCIANIRSSRQALQLAERLVNERFAYDEMMIRAFYTMAAIRMTGHKWVLSYELDSNGLPVPTANSNPYNALQGYTYSYMEPLFPQPPDLDKVLPLDLRLLDQYGRVLSNSNDPTYISTGPRGEHIFQVWYSEDWWRSEILDLPEYKELMKYTMPVSLLPGYTNAPVGTQTEVIGNFVFKQMSHLPRFAESTEGGLTVIQDMVEVPVDAGNRALYNYRQRDNAPFGMAMLVGKGMGNIVTRPILTTGVEGRPIQPIGGSLTGADSWIYWNEYDKECNPEKNMPYFKKHVEIGLKQTNPDAGKAMIFRFKNFRVRPTNICDLRPKMVIAPVSSNCAILEIGCNPLNQPTMAGNQIIKQDNTRTILCSAKLCAGSTNIYRLEFTRENPDSIAVNQNPLPCGCGDHVDVLINDEDGNFVSKIDGTLIDFSRPTLERGPIWLVELASGLSDGQCVHGVVCVVNNNTTVNVVACEDHTDDPDLANTKLRVTSDTLWDVAVGDTVHVKWYDEDNTQLGSLPATVSIVDYDTFTYTLTSTQSITCSVYDTSVLMKLVKP
jgi:hypothetical protein